MTVTIILIVIRIWACFIYQSDMCLFDIEQQLCIYGNVNLYLYNNTYNNKHSQKRSSS
jgi:uncharacterized membrane protein YiaA